MVNGRVQQRTYIVAADSIIEAMKNVKYGDPFDPENIMGPLNSAMQRERVEGYIATLGPRHADTMMAQAYLGDTRLKLGDAAGAVALARTSVDAPCGGISAAMAHEALLSALLLAPGEVVFLTFNASLGEFGKPEMPQMDPAGIMKQ